MPDPSSAGFPKIGYSCPIPWDQMHGSSRERFCEKCQRTVVNLSLMTRAERKSLLSQKKDLCVAYYQRVSGEPVGIDTQGLRLNPASGLLKTAAALALVSTLPAFLGGCATPKQAANPPPASHPTPTHDKSGVPIDPDTKQPVRMNIGY